MNFINVNNLKNLNITAWIISIVVPLVVLLLFQLDTPLELPIKSGYLPMFNAIINSNVAIFLIMAIFAIKKGNILLHERFINIAIILSVLFLVVYILNKLSFNDAYYGDTDGNRILTSLETEAVANSRIIYLFILISHILLSIIIIPFVCFTYLRGLVAKSDAKASSKHKKLSRITFPLWLYVAISGVIVYVMMIPYY